MKFITETELRTLYRKTPFTTYKLSEESRLTPGARQFLTDFRIELDDEKEKKLEQMKKIHGIQSDKGKVEVRINYVEENQVNPIENDEKIDIIKNKFMKSLAIKLKNLALLIKQVNSSQAQDINDIAVQLFQGKFLPGDEGETLDGIEELYNSVMCYSIEAANLDVLVKYVTLDFDLSNLQSEFEITQVEGISIESSEMLKIIKSLRLKIYKSCLEIAK